MPTGPVHLNSSPLILFIGLRVCRNTADRLMGDSSMTRETTLATELFDLSFAELG